MDFLNAAGFGGTPFAVNICPIARLPDCQPTLPVGNALRAGGTALSSLATWSFARSSKRLSHGAHVPLNMSAARFSNPYPHNNLRNRTAKKIPNMSAHVTSDSCPYSTCSLR
jgi:hypothetical protein